MLSRFVISVFCLFSLCSISASVDNVIYNCWDGSFMYRVATLATHGDRVEVGITSSSNLITANSEDAIYDDSGFPITEHGSYNHTFYFSFLASECQNHNETWTCNVALQNDFFGLSNRLFIARSIFNLDDFIINISKVRVNQLTVQFSPTAINAKIVVNNIIGLSTAEIDFNLEYCDASGRHGGTTFGNAEFPPELRSYVMKP